MKLYIKANHIKILKNLETLLPYAQAKSAFLVDNNSHEAYKTNLKSAEILQEMSEKLFYENRHLKQLVKGIYFGNSSCEHLMPSIVDVVEAQQICKEKHYNFVFVFAPLSHSKMEEAAYILQHLNTQVSCEVVVNDIGVLQMVLEHKNLKPILGLNFTKVIKNAFIDAVEPTDLSKKQLENQQELLSHMEFEVEEVRAFYKSMGVGRFSIENIALNLDFLDSSPKMQCDLYYPYVVLANSKACDIAGAFEDQRGYFVYDDCPKYCNYASLEFAHQNILDMHQRYNSIYKTSSTLDMPENLYKEKRNRLVWEVFV